MNLVSFFLEQDYATKMPFEVNNDINKPETALPGVNYRYIRSNPNGQKLYKYKWVGVTDPMGDMVWQQVVDYYLTDKPYEALAHACSTWGKALGAQNVAQGAIIPGESVDLSDESKFDLPGEERDGFGDEHSGQFEANIQYLKGFYDELINKLQIGPANQ